MNIYTASERLSVGWSACFISVKFYLKARITIVIRSLKVCRFSVKVAYGAHFRTSSIGIRILTVCDNEALAVKCDEVTSSHLHRGSIREPKSRV